MIHSILLESDYIQVIICTICIYYNNHSTKMYSVLPNYFSIKINYHRPIYSPVDMTYVLYNGDEPGRPIHRIANAFMLIRPTCIIT